MKQMVVFFSNKVVPGFYDYYPVYEVPPPKAPFPEKVTAEEQKCVSSFFFQLSVSGLLSFGV